MAALGLKNTQRITREPSFELERIQSRLENTLNSRIIPKLSQFTNRLANNQGILQQAATRQLDIAKRQTGLMEGVLAQQSPKAIMQKGWMLAMKDAQLLRSLKDIQTGDHLELHLHDGQAEVVVESTKQDPQ
jgi:exonuclease VII large subunit